SEFVLSVTFKVSLTEIGRQVVFRLSKCRVCSEEKISKALFRCLLPGRTRDRCTCRVEANQALRRTGCGRIIERTECTLVSAAQLVLILAIFGIFDTEFHRMSIGDKRNIAAEGM